MIDQETREQAFQLAYGYYMCSKQYERWLEEEKNKLIHIKETTVWQMCKSHCADELEELRQHFRRSGQEDIDNLIKKWRG